MTPKEFSLRPLEVVPFCDLRIGDIFSFVGVPEANHMFVREVEKIDNEFIYFLTFVGEKKKLRDWMELTNTSPVTRISSKEYDASQQPFDEGDI